MAQTLTVSEDKSKLSAELLNKDESALVAGFRGIPDPIVKWLLGHTAKEPAGLDNLLDQIANKINIVLAVLVTNRLASINKVTAAMEAIEKKLFAEENLDKLTLREVLSLYKHFDNTQSEFLEFVRKFVGQNKEFLLNRHPADELAGLLRNVDPTVLHKLVEFLKDRGASVTEADIGSELKRPSDDLLAELVR